MECGNMTMKIIVEQTSNTKTEEITITRGLNMVQPKLGLCPRERELEIVSLIKLVQEI